MLGVGIHVKPSFENGGVGCLTRTRAAEIGESDEDKWVGEIVGPQTGSDHVEVESKSKVVVLPCCGHAVAMPLIMVL